jgi:mRNA-degrading endonuclease toxin of MazEF toxin-antitoxin module
MSDAGRVIVCPFVPGSQPPAGVEMTVAVAQPAGYLLPELIQSIPTSALDEAIGAASPTTLFEAVMVVNSLIS